MRVLAERQRTLRKELEGQGGKVERAQRSLDKTAATQAKIHARLAGQQEEAATLDECREIFEHDVDQDSLFTLLRWPGFPGQLYPA